MERVKTLCDKLNKQLVANAPAADMLLTVQLLQSELVHLQASGPQPGSGPAIRVNFSGPAQRTTVPKVETVQAPEERTVEILQVDEAEVEAELDEIKRNAEELNKMIAHNKPSLLFDPIEDIPTLTHQQAPAAAAPLANEPEPDNTSATKKELHQHIVVEQKASLNEKLKQIKIELSDTLKDTAIKDLKKGIGVNDRFLFINELFRGDETMYERSIKTINGFSIFPEAEYWIKRELKLKLGWNDQHEAVQQFDQLVKRRFS